MPDRGPLHRRGTDDHRTRHSARRAPHRWLRHTDHRNRRHETKACQRPSARGGAMSPHRRTDPVQLTLGQKQIDHVSRTMGWVMTRTARSPIFSQSHDFSCFVSDARGQVVSQADGIPIHTGSGGFGIRRVLEDFASDIGPGDVFILNDPYDAGGNHLPDWTVIRPVFLDEELLAFTANRAHQSDIGGGAAGTYNAAATEIFHEGVRLPVLKLVEAGRPRRDLMRLLRLTSRTPG